MKLTNCKTAPDIFPPDAKYPPIIGGIVQGTAIPAGLATSPVDIAIYVVITSTNGVRINGISMMGFITIGIPNVIGSFILKIPGPIANLPNCFICWLLALITIASTKAKVAPLPPI